jgi:hypothetical protein
VSAGVEDGSVVEGEGLDGAGPADVVRVDTVDVDEPSVSSWPDCAFMNAHAAPDAVSRTTMAAAARRTARCTRCDPGLSCLPTTQ